jgi:MFS family permease
MQFYTARFLLGAFEAGLFPGVIFYLSAWLPAKRRAHSVALFMTATVVSGLIGGPLSGWIMTGLDGVNGWRGWHWLFLTEGVPSSLYGVLLYFCLPDRPSDARWLSAKESAFLAEVTAAEQRATAAVTGNQSFLQSFANPKLYVLSAASFMTLCSVYAVSFWMPLMIKATGVDNPFHIGLYAMIPNAVTLAAMIIIGRHSDRTLERRWHYALAALAGAGGLALTTLGTDSLPLALVGLAIAQAGVITALPLFWAVATSVLPRSSAAGALAVINSVGNLGGFFAPSIIGFVKTATGSLSYGLRITAAITALAGVMMLLGISKRALDAVRAGGSGERFS